jgi:nicotinate-nucleotide adenylyltransferase
MERLGIYGGTFDPPHFGHLALARTALAQLKLTRVLWVLTPNPPHKTGHFISSIEDRLEMLRLALADQPGFEVSAIDLDRPAPHYAVDTLHLLRTHFPQAVLVYLMGVDSLRDLPTWHQPAEVVAAADELGVLSRPGVEVDWEALRSRLPGLQEKVRWILAPPLAISATQVRALASRQADLSPYLPQAVLAYVVQKGLYCEED